MVKTAHQRVSCAFETPTDSSRTYRGRFAPSPSGPLHFGSLVAALGSYLDARHYNGEWFLRIEDIDPPREVAGASEQIIRTLTAYGFEWDGSITYQSQQHELYQAALDHLTQCGLCYRCTCTRKQIQAYGGVYNNQCRQLGHTTEESSTRFFNRFPVTHFTDRLLGNIRVPAARATEDFIIRRRDKLFAYHLAMVVDDIELGITDVVRGSDLIEPTACQLALYRGFEKQSPAYLHLPLALGSPGNKLSKHNYSPPIKNDKARETLHLALQFLGQPVDDLQHYDSPQSLLAWGIKHWDISRLPKGDQLISDAVAVVTATE